MDIFPTRILLATDGSEEAAMATQAAADLSRLTGSELHLVHAWRSLPHYAYPSLVPEGYRPPYEEGARKILAQQVEQVREAGGTVAEAHLKPGAPADEILDLIEELRPGLLIAGSRGLGPIKHLLLGSVTEALVHHAACPVLVVRGTEEAWPPGRIVVGDDGSEAARRAGEVAAAIGGLFDARMLLARTRPEPPRQPGLPDYDESAYRQMVEDYRRRELAALEERAGELHDWPGVRTEVRVVIGDDAAETILEGSGREVSTLIAVGSRGLGPIRRVRLGSVSSRVLRVARGSVLVSPSLHKVDERGA